MPVSNYNFEILAARVNSNFLLMKESGCNICKENIDKEHTLILPETLITARVGGGVLKAALGKIGLFSKPRFLLATTVEHLLKIFPIYGKLT